MKDDRVKDVSGAAKADAQRLANQARKKLHGYLTRLGQEWDKAYEHVRLHFKAFEDKPSHTVFIKKYRNKENLLGLMRQAVSGPSRSPVLTQLKKHGEHVGEYAVLIERKFGMAIGESGEKVLWIFTDTNGYLITAYPTQRAYAEEVEAEVISKEVKTGKE